jgi:uncharacterized protein YigA (DUF484 family)
MAGRAGRLSGTLQARSHERARDEAIRAFLLARPEFLKNDPELLRRLGLRPEESNVIDFSREALSRAARAHRRETSVRRRLEAVAQANFEALATTHDAVLELLDAANPTDLSGRMMNLARNRFGLTAAILATEGDAPDGWRPLLAGQCDLALGPGRPTRLGVAPTTLGLFGVAAPEIGSVAVVRLQLSPPPRQGLLAFGAAAADAFSSDMGQDLIAFLARVVERVAARWPM